MYIVLLLLITSGSFAQNERSAQGHEHNPWYSNTDTTHLQVSNGEWKKILSADLYAVAREKDTERPFTGKYWKSTTRGTYYCAVCGNRLFRSDTKFASSCGWPSFYEPVSKTSVRYQQMIRMRCTGPKCYAVVAIRTSATFLTMDHRLPISGFA